MTTPRICQNYINGEWLPNSEQATLESRNPANFSEIVAIFPRSNEETVNKAVKAARQAYNSWRKIPAPVRAEYIFRVGELLLQHKEELAQLICQEMGKPLAEARGDVQEGIDCAFYSAGEGRRL
jgi:aldehyde dehydrogenase (NAD+)